MQAPSWLLITDRAFEEETLIITNRFRSHTTPHNRQKRFDGAGFSMTGTQAVLNSIASNCLVDEGEVVNAAEIFWTPGEPSETLTSTDLIVDFPELVTL
jgi:Protein of unknown function (DUF1517)